MFGKTETAFLRQLCCDITNEFVHHSDQVFVLKNALSSTIDKFMISSSPCYSRSNVMPSAPGIFSIFNARRETAYNTPGWSCN